jgi:hypothetical protein
MVSDEIHKEGPEHVGLPIEDEPEMESLMQG